ncbi:glycoside hydrolase family 19 protein [Cupriavidus sp. 30B13]|uniref:glycoside hydrolase family 19 protein n=1 Tax=Cupriavidus sp. 30B13 TaxID=3384241 RepID=UPI003B912222
MPPSSQTSWNSEKTRIAKLVWWEDVTKKVKHFPIDQFVYHLHPIGVAANLMGSDCSCGEALTKEQLSSIAPQASEDSIAEYIDSINSMFDKFAIHTCINRAHILAQMLHESGSFRYTKELGTNLSYDPWRGRGLIQITGMTNYIKYGDSIGEDTISNAAAYQKLEKSPHAVLSAGWYWSEFKNLSKSGDEDDFIWCTAVVNGAYNGYNDRLSHLNRATSALKIGSCAPKNKSGNYIFSESKAYDNRRYSFAWGLWHDPASNKSGVTKSTQKAIDGYQRYIDLHEAAGRPAEPSLNKYWYGLIVSSYRNFAETQINRLKDEQ